VHEREVYADGGVYHGLQEDYCGDGAVGMYVYM
jgi:hypothetical protein